MEEPLGPAHRKASLNALVIFSFFIAVCLPLRAEDGSSCSTALLDDLIPHMIDHVAESRPENTALARDILHLRKQEIEKRILAACPTPETCNEDQLAEIVMRIVHGVLDENPIRSSKWKSRLTLTAGLLAYCALSAWIMGGVNLSNSAGQLLTVLGSVAILSIGASIIEIPVGSWRRQSYAHDNEQKEKERGARQKRHLQTYLQTQRAIESTEEEGRTTEREIVLQLCAAKSAMGGCASESEEEYMESAAYIIAMTLADIVPAYIDLDFSDPFYAKLWRTFFSRKHIDDSNREAFRQQVLELIPLYYDAEAQPGTAKWEKYQRVLKSWTAPLLPLIVSTPNR